jgi:lactate permease
VLAPYLALVALVVVTRLPGLRETLAEIELAWALGDYAGSFAPLYHPGTLLFGALAQGAGRDVGPALRDAGARIAPVVVALLVMLLLARVLVHGGLIDRLAVAAGEGLGPVWPLAAPLVGVLGTFVTGSATTSNILFTELQARIAGGLDLSLPLVLGAQSFGAAVGNILCPHNIVAGCATVGLVGREGEILRRTVWVGLAYALLGGLVALGWVWAVS